MTEQACRVRRFINDDVSLSARSRSSRLSVLQDGKEASECTAHNSDIISHYETSAQIRAPV